MPDVPRCGSLTATSVCADCASELVGSGQEWRLPAPDSLQDEAILILTGQWTSWARLGRVGDLG